MADQGRFHELDYFTDQSVLVEPSQYLNALRGECPVYQGRQRDIIYVTGYRETLEVLNNPADFSSVIAPGGPVVPLPFVPQGDDLTAQIEANRDRIPTAELLVALDDQRHSYSRAILNRLFTPSRLRANEPYVHDLADKLVKDAVAKGGCELVADIATPFVTLVIANLLGVPEDDRETFRRVLDQGPPPGNMESATPSTDVGPLEFMAGFFVRYILERRANPTDDVLTELALAQYPDGSTPDVGELVRLATFLFGAGQDTSAKLLGNAMRLIVERPDLQQTLREDRTLIAPFLEEVLRLEGSSKVTFRLARRNSRVGDVEIPAGKKLMLSLTAANRDPARWDDADAFELNRPKIREHLAFGRGAHVCSGAPLARMELRIIIDRFLEHTAHMSLADGGEPLAYEPSFIVRGLNRMDLALTPSADPATPPS